MRRQCHSWGPGAAAVRGQRDGEALAAVLPGDGKPGGAERLVRAAGSAGFEVTAVFLYGSDLNVCFKRPA